MFAGMKLLLQRRVLYIAIFDRLEDTLPVCEALLAGGLDCLEVPLRTDCALASIKAIRKSFPQMHVGAGTVLSVDQLKQAIDAGATYAVAPGLNEKVVNAARDLNMPFIPGVMTPTETDHAIALGCLILKLFPAGVLGGPAMLKALAAPFAHTGAKFIPMGGVSQANVAEYLAIPETAAIGGTWLADRKLIADKNWARITELTKAVMGIAATAKR
jgi:2-dehydro-3-deoxyphosphogluconate aldolase/(4S)-4-hydroxy-2-oxoglutarate aldolase